MNEIQHIIRATQSLTKLREHKCDSELKGDCESCVDIEMMAECKHCRKRDDLGLVAWMVNNHDPNPTFCYGCFDKAAPIVRGGAVLCHKCLYPMLVEHFDTWCYVVQGAMEHYDVGIYYDDTDTYEICKSKHVCVD